MQARIDDTKTMGEVYKENFLEQDDNQKFIIAIPITHNNENYYLGLVLHEDNKNIPLVKIAKEAISVFMRKMNFSMAYSDKYIVTEINNCINMDEIYPEYFSSLEELIEQLSVIGENDLLSNSSKKRLAVTFVLKALFYLNREDADSLKNTIERYAIDGEKLSYLRLKIGPTTFWGAKKNCYSDNTSSYIKIIAGLDAAINGVQSPNSLSEKQEQDYESEGMLAL